MEELRLESIALDFYFKIHPTAYYCPSPRHKRLMSLPCSKAFNGSPFPYDNPIASLAWHSRLSMISLQSTFIYYYSLRVYRLADHGTREFHRETVSLLGALSYAWLWWLCSTCLSPPFWAQGTNPSTFFSWQWQRHRASKPGCTRAFQDSG